MAYTLRYSNPTGSGARDGTSEADAWSWSDVLANQVGGQFVWHKGDVTTAAATQSWANSSTGDAENPFGLGGYSVTPGDLGGSRTDAGALVGGFPVITNPVTGSNVGFDLPEYCDISGFHFKCTLNSTYVVDSAPADDFGFIYACNIETASSSGRLLQSNADSKHFINIDLINSGTSTTDMVTLGRSFMEYFRITNPGGSLNSSQSAIKLSSNNAHVAHGQILDFGVAIETTSMIQGSVSHVSARNCKTFCYNTDSTSALHLSHVIAWGDNSAGSEFYKGSRVCPVRLTNCASGNFADANQDIGDWPVSGSIALSADPFTSSSDLRLNDTAGGGAACKGVGIFGNNLGSIDPDPASSGGGFISHRGMNGALVG